MKRQSVPATLVYLSANLTTLQPSLLPFLEPLTLEMDVASIIIISVLLRNVDGVNFMKGTYHSIPSCTGEAQQTLFGTGGGWSPFWHLTETFVSNPIKNGKITGILIKKERICRQ
jgi:hypothetical protein